LVSSTYLLQISTFGSWTNDFTLLIVLLSGMPTSQVFIERWCRKDCKSTRNKVASHVYPWFIAKGSQTSSTFLRSSRGGLRPSTVCSSFYISQVLGLKVRHNNFFLDRCYVVFQNIFVWLRLCNRKLSRGL
jgi:hypothetical protein